MEKESGFFDTYWDEKSGKIFVEINRWDEDFLYVNSLAAGLGSNDIGLDRNQLGSTRLVQFRRVGPKVLLMERNLDYRAESDNPDERASVADAFAQSVIHGFKSVAQSGNRVLIDVTPLLLTDAHGVIGRLKRGKQGNYRVEGSRSAVYRPGTKNFPKNSEFEALITFTGQATGRQIRSVTPNSSSFSLRMHHSFIELPDENYTPRTFDPRSGYFSRSYADYATPIDQSLVKRFIVRHRLEKKDPSAAISDPVEPIVYYLDRGAPEPIRSALIEGASWWNQAFEAAGYRNAFQVKVLPEDADPLDVRYNVINWVHRSTRGWSYGSSVVDPRTGEIIKGHVLLGSLRVRQDFLIAQGMVQAYEKGDQADPRLLEMALARLRQLGAHEVGHTLGLAHNFAASTKNRSSVMDYPHPYLTLRRGYDVDFSEAYDTGIGEWDKRTILYGYQDFPAGTSEKEALENILRENQRLGLPYLSDADARPVGSAHPAAHLWDNGSDPTQEMQRLLDLRKTTLHRLNEKNIPTGSPMFNLESVLVPVYLMHRYQVEAVSKVIGGYHYTYSVRQENGPSDEVRPVSAEDQRQALHSLLKTLDPETLALPEHLFKLIPPPAQGLSRNREMFKTHNGGGLDPLAMAEAAADNTFKFLLHPHRLARLEEQYVLYGSSFMSMSEYLEEINQKTANISNSGSSYERAISKITQKRFVEHLLQLAANKQASEDVRAHALGLLTHISNTLENTGFKDASYSHKMYLRTRIEQFLDDPSSVEPVSAPSLPDGSPIGCGEFH